MRFMSGYTRWVILTKKYAFKIARFRPVRPLVRFIQLLIERKITCTLQGYHPNPVLAVIKYITSGIIANRREYQLYKKHGNELLAPTLFTVFYIVNIQRRGLPITGREAESHYLWKLLSGQSTTMAQDILQRKQFCNIDGKVCLADYGGEGLESIILEYNYYYSI